MRDCMKRSLSSSINHSALERPSPRTKAWLSQLRSWEGEYRTSNTTDPRLMPKPRSDMTSSSMTIRCATILQRTATV
ncbi:hypothetical protein IEQ34_025184 [Dendrobium chrysotoxum]|uniref:Uncharacterized protein n=1 Tax=Dendrobium chrysotoxum TaxID=161865 RepID=A0AAV7FQV5_DENCH|nr:hypothetical protein IEQ34_025184 [Dendrobium chrysotoxum]